MKFSMFFSDSVCNKFQDFEIDHIENMLAFSLSFADSVHKTFEQLANAQSDFYRKIKSLTGVAILQAFAEQKQTGSDRPSKIEQRTETSKTFFSFPSISAELNYEDPDASNNSESK